ncbi:MAG: hypothetical protein OXI81_05270 [Paracoccaceae bacterium]|nr:hypothetical protein [Paracoccaceae bacterium]
MLGVATGKDQGRQLHLNRNFDIVGRWEKAKRIFSFGHASRFQPRRKMMASSERAMPTH